jgi:hypothetical protein
MSEVCLIFRRLGTNALHVSLYPIHTGLQKLDGLYGSIVVRQAPSQDPNSHLYDFDLTTHVILISDWLHEDAIERYPGRLAVNPGQDPDTVLINGKGQFMVMLHHNQLWKYWKMCPEYLKSYVKVKFTLDPTQCSEPFLKDLAILCKF